MAVLICIFLMVSTLSTSCKQLTHWKRPWCWEGLGAGAEGDDRGWHGWMASPTRWTWVWVNSRSWWWTGRPGLLRFMGLQRVGHDWATELNWTELNWMVSDAEYLYIFQVALCISFLKKCLFKTPTFWFGGGVCYWVVGISYVFWILTPYQIHGLQIFFSFHMLPLISKIVSFAVQNVLVCLFYL